MGDYERKCTHLYLELIACIIIIGIVLNRPISADNGLRKSGGKLSKDYQNDHDQVIVDGYSNGQPVVDTAHGTVHGIYFEEARAFLGIPYAAPPVGDLRWAPPQEPEPWSEPRNTTEHSLSCPQFPYNETKMSEDCLYVNIYTPLDANPTSNYPVIVILHGGYFVMNSNSRPKFDGRFLANSSVVAVVPNFRIGALGFLYTGDDTILGNFAIRDQQASLKFVQQNIVAFGGDPDKVTLMGPSSGAESTAVHLTSPSSENLFHQAIMTSIYVTGQFRKANADAPLFGKKFARYAGCVTASPACLRKLPVETILNIQTLLMYSDTGQVDGEGSIQYMQPWSPVIDGDLIHMQLLDAFETIQFQRKPMIIGVARDDARNFAFQLNQEPMDLPDYLKFILQHFPAEKAAKIAVQYPAIIGVDNRDTLGVLLTDFNAVCSSRYVSNIVTSNDITVYHYIYDNPLSQNVTNLNYCIGYSCHNGDSLFMFHNAVLQNYTYNATEERLADSMLYYWTNFAHTGNPDDDDWRTETKDFSSWPAYDTNDNWPSMRFTQPDNGLFLDYRSKGCTFWDEIGYSVKSSINVHNCLKSSP
ncbi:cAMP-regulated D2 protein-like [Amphiura filiformis]|uniref:cAMP-regulated D2 protein-like n=1 Tax=Amphiura filiformis TaxID=82378 RepID=UPI003B2147DC